MIPSASVDLFGLASASAVGGLVAFTVPALRKRRRADAASSQASSQGQEQGTAKPVQALPDDVPLDNPPLVQALPVAAAEPQLPGADDAHDPLTGLPTRRQFAARLQSAVVQARDHGACSSLLLINLQGRQSVIAQHGASTSDGALREITRRLEAMLKESEMLARLGDDEFAVIAEGRAEPGAHRDAADRMAAIMIDKILQPVPANDCELRFGAHIGVALCRSGIAGGAELLRSAARNMRNAREHVAAPDSAEPWKPPIRKPGPTLERTFVRTLEQDVRRALTAGEFLPFYQPVVDLAANRICGFEALARWRHPRRGFVAPDVFIPAMERMNMIPALTQTILTQVCHDAQHWRSDIHVAINISPSELSDPMLVRRILRITEQEGMNPGQLEVEITETAIVQNVAAAQASLLAFRQAGIVTALDDFGTGYASLAQLRQFKFDRLKIDRSFVHGMLQNEECDKIVDAILGLAKSLNLKTVAEGIETAAVAANLTARGCEFGQGFYYGKALTAKAALALVQAGAYPTVAA